MKIPLLTGDPKVDVQAIYEALFPKFQTIALVLVGVTGTPSCILTRMGRFCHVQVFFKGSSTSSTGSFKLPITPLQACKLDISTTISLGIANLAKDGTVTLPNWSATDVLISGLVIEV